MAIEGREKCFVNQFDVDLCEDITKVSSITMRFPKCVATDSGNFQYKTYQPGLPVYGDITFTGVNHKETFNKIQSWVNDCYNGKGDVSRKDITVNLRKHQQKDPIRTFNLFSTFPKEFNYVDIAAEGHADVTVKWTLVVRVTQIKMA